MVQAAALQDECVNLYVKTVTYCAGHTMTFSLTDPAFFASHDDFQPGRLKSGHVMRQSHDDFQPGRLKFGHVMRQLIIIHFLIINLFSIV